MIIANKIRDDLYPFGHDDNEAVYISKNGYVKKWGKTDKKSIAWQIIDLVTEEYKQHHAS